MNTYGMTKGIMDLPVITFRGKKLNDGTLYKVIYREYESQYPKEDDPYEIKSFYVMAEYLCFKRDKKNVRCFIYSLRANNMFHILNVSQVNVDGVCYYNVFDDDLPNRNIEDFVPCELDDFGLLQSEVEFFTPLRERILKRNEISARTGNYPFVHFFVRKMYNTWDYDSKDKVVRKDWERCPNRRHWGSCYLRSWFNHEYIENVYSFGIFTTEYKTSEKLTPLSIAYFSDENGYKAVIENEKVQNEIDSELDALNGCGMAEIDTFAIRYYNNEQIKFKTFV